MRTSVRRQCRRQQMGVNRKTSVTRWIGKNTVRVLFSVVTDRGCSYSKASEGVEKSLRPARRRKRGLRHGKTRSRVGKTRRTKSHAAPVDKKVSDRHVVRHLRMNDHWWDRGDAFEKRIKSAKKENLVTCRGLPGTRYLVWKSRWLALSSRVPRVVRLDVFGPTFSYYLEKHLKLILAGGPSARRVLNDLLETRRINDSLDRIEPVRAHKYTVTCSWCREAWSSPGRSSRCPSCSRMCLGEMLHRRNATRGRRGNLARGR
jgi:hypothetical protein